MTGNKIDAFPVDEPVIRYISGVNDKITYIPEYMDPFDFAFVFRKNDEGKKLAEEFSEFLEQLKSNGKLEELQNIWFGTDEK